MSFPYRRVLVPVDFDGQSIAAIETAAQIVRQNDGVALVMHVVPMMIPPTGMPGYVDLYRGQEETARVRLTELAHRHLAGLKYELFVHVGEPAASILRAEKRLAADLVVMATHGRRGFSRVFLGSVAEMVLREATCPVLTVHQGKTENRTVERWMTRSPATVTPGDKLAVAATRMTEGGFRSLPVVDGEKLVGIITDRDLRTHVGYHDHTEVKLAMTEPVVTITPETPVHEAARLLRERKIGALPVVEDGRLVGIISTVDVLEALTAETE